MEYQTRKGALALVVAGALSCLGGTAAAQPTTRYTVFRVGADAGMARIANEGFWQIDATGLLRLGPFRTDFAAPLRFSTDGFRFREADYAQGRDYLRIVRCARLDIGDYHRPADRYDPACDSYASANGGLHDRQYLSLRFAPLRDLDLGHGTLLTGFNNSLDPNVPQIGGVAHLIFRDIAVGHAVVDDIASPTLLAAQVGLRPLQVLGQNWDETPDDLRVDVGVVRDMAAPLRVRSAFGEPLRDGDGRIQSTTTPLTALSASAHYLYLLGGCTQQGSAGCEAVSRTGLFGFVDYNRLMEVVDGDGLHVGVHFRYLLRQRYHQLNDQSLGSEGRMFDTWEVRVGAEYRNMGNRYLPGYFDGNYSVQRNQFALNDAARQRLGSDAATTSKLEYLLAQPEGRGHGFQAYFRLYLPVPTAANEPPSRLPITLFAEDSSGPLRASVGASVGPFRIDQLVIGAQYLRRNFDSLSAIFNPEGALVRVMGAVHLSSAQQRRSAPDNLLSNLMVNFSYNRRFLQQDNGALASTNDFFVTLGTSTGIN